MSPFRWLRVGVLGACLGLETAVVSAQPLSGPIARADFRLWAAHQGGTWLDFDALLPGAQLQRQLEARHGVVFNSTAGADGRPLPGGIPVLVTASRALRAGKLAIVGTTIRATLDDAGVTFEIRFAQPQRWAGLERIGSRLARTRFLAPGGELLHEAADEGFHGWLGTAATNSWVARIEVTGVEREGTREVGFADDLVFGTSPIPPSTLYLSLRPPPPVELPPLLAPRHRVDYRRGGAKGSSDWLMIVEGDGGSKSATNAGALEVLLEPPPRESSRTSPTIQYAAPE